jgi:membrane protein required for colicin V production
MNWIDLLGLMVLVVLFFIGVAKGLIRELTTFVGILISFFLALHLMGLAATRIEKWVTISPKAALLVGFLSLFVVFVVLFYLFGYLLYRIVRATPLTIFDRIAGGLFGLLKGGVIIFVLLLLASFVPFKGAPARQLETSVMYGTVRRTAPVFAQYLRRSAPVFLRLITGSEKSALLRTGDAVRPLCRADQIDHRALASIS